MREPVVIATWPFGRLAAETALQLLRAGQPALDAALTGAQAVEDDPNVRSVGYAGLPNAIGVVQLDACVMDGRTLRCGAVAGVENVRHPAALARRVMEKTPHVLLVGAGAQQFALREGFPLENLLTPESLQEWENRRARERPPTPGGGQPPEAGDHDTVTVLALDQRGDLGGVCTTSGLAHKLPGRVGDSPIIGAGLYVDNSAGAAGGTGVGEEIIRVAGSFLIVEAMRAGRSPQEACEAAVRRVNAAAVRRGVHPARVAFIALDPQGRTGAACTARTGFQYAVGRGDKVELVTAREVEAQAGN
ncbi:MAG: N(4)-(beta-N-acetylglucosaminyl)-L-asparaginase [Gemmataceae bacterium]|nr:N(4)-(beta-N-acetylglucosaminyl)-L-asparaginase [Gemmataceae bacterium]MDW8266978.1 N(4)-(beta-N-acetylglucosaminyl)-L-asparaginase [Gemmataceae bacterium]